MAGKFSTTIKDKGFKKAMETFKEVAGKPAVTIGVHENTGKEKGSELTVVEVATFNEFGTENIPERSFIRSTVDQNFESYVQKTKILQNKCILQQISVSKALAVLGELIQLDIIKTINSGVEPANSPETLKAKTVNGKVGTTTLVDSGQMKQSIRYKVENV